MIGKNSTDEKVHKECAMDVSRLMTALIRKYRHHPNILGMVLTDSLATYVALVSQDAESMLLTVAERIKIFNWRQTKSDFFGWRVLDGGRGNARDETEDGRIYGADEG